MTIKTMRGDLLVLHQKLVDGKNFSFSKFSDGELFVLQNKRLILSPKPEHHGYQSAYDYKDFDPDLHQFHREKLFEALRYCHPNYYLGIIAPSDQNLETHRWMKNESRKTDKNLTWANVLVNSNYTTFRDLLVPEFGKHPIVLVCNKDADYSRASFAGSVVKDFRVGYNCMINDYGMIEEIKTWIAQNNITNHLFLFACSTLGRYLSHQLQNFSDANTYFEIGSSLNIDIGLSPDRGYLAAYLKQPWRGEADTSNDLIRQETWDENGVPIE